jgi:hypothetical protein
MQKGDELFSASMILQDCVANGVAESAKEFWLTGVR